MKSYFPLPLLMLLISAVFSCDYVDPEDFREGSTVLVSKWDIDSSFINQDSVQPAMVLLEEYTGQFCGNCPGAARKAIKLDSVYGKKMHVMAIHAGYFSEPQNNPNGSDFRCLAGNYLDSKFKVSETIPKGLINRGRFGGSRTSLLASTAWEGKITEVLNRPPTDFTLYLNAFFDVPSQQFYAISHLKFRNPVVDSLQIELFLVEDSIVNWQLDYGAAVQQVPNYIHRHVLRDGFSPVGGSESAGLPPFATGKISTGRWVLNRREEVLRKNCKVIAVVSRVSDDEIIQAVEGKIIDR
jgi:hypothetical protein